MRANWTLEIGTGFFVVLGFAALFFLTTQLPSSGLKLSVVKPGYHLSAEFDNIGDLKVGSPVTMAGVSIGEVDKIRFDPKTFRAVVGLRIDSQYNQIPDDSYASIQTQGLLGGKYVGFSPGGSDTNFKDGGHIDQTQSAIVLESLINKLFASFADKSGQASGNASGGGAGNAQGSGNAQGGGAHGASGGADRKHGNQDQGGTPQGTLK